MINNYSLAKDGYSIGTVDVYINKKTEIENPYGCWADQFEDYSYRLEFIYDQRYWGYCTCDPSMPQYNKEHGCCGMGCDWDAPAFFLRKIINYDLYKWEGQECDYWIYEKQFNATEENKNAEDCLFRLF
jgi:hypothetical protein